MSTFVYDINTEEGIIHFNGELNLKDIGDWDGDCSEFLNVFMKASGKNKISSQMGALSLLLEVIENQEGTEIIVEH